MEFVFSAVSVIFFYTFATKLPETRLKRFPSTGSPPIMQYATYITSDFNKKKLLLIITKVSH